MCHKVRCRRVRFFSKQMVSNEHKCMKRRRQPKEALLKRFCIHIYFHKMSQGTMSQGKMSQGKVLSRVNILGFRSPSRKKGRKEENNQGATVEELVEEPKNYDENDENWNNAMVGEFLDKVSDSEDDD